MSQWRAASLLAEQSFDREHPFLNTESKHSWEMSRLKIHFYSQYKYNLMSSGKAMDYYPSHQVQLSSRGCTTGRVT